MNSATFQEHAIGFNGIKEHPVIFDGFSNLGFNPNVF
jgi:hypothetical protein